MKYSESFSLPGRIPSANTCLMAECCYSVKCLWNVKIDDSIVTRCSWSLVEYLSRKSNWCSGSSTCGFISFSNTFEMPAFVIDDFHDFGICGYVFQPKTMMIPFRDHSIKTEGKIPLIAGAFLGLIYIYIDLLSNFERADCS